MSRNETDKPADVPPAEELQRLLKAAEQGDLKVLPQLRHLLDHSPELWDQYGNLALHAECALVKLAAGPNVLLAESLVRKLTALKAEVAGPTPSPLERLLAERIAACWLQVAYFDAVLAQAKGVDLAKADHLRRQQESANRRYLAAVRQLATVRKFLVPPPPTKVAGEKNETRSTRTCPRRPFRGTAVENFGLN
jgi:hypothetical protein